MAQVARGNHQLRRAVCAQNAPEYLHALIWPDCVGQIVGHRLQDAGRCLRVFLLLMLRAQRFKCPLIQFSDGEILNLREFLSVFIQDSDIKSQNFV